MRGLGDRLIWYVLRTAEVCERKWKGSGSALEHMNATTRGAF